MHYIESVILNHSSVRINVEEKKAVAYKIPAPVKFDYTIPNASSVSHSRSRSRPLSFSVSRKPKQPRKIYRSRKSFGNKLHMYAYVCVCLL